MVADRLKKLEKNTGRRIGVFVHDSRAKHSFGYRADESFAMCSTWKPLCVAAVLDATPAISLNERVRFTRSELLEYSPITSREVDWGMTVRQLCAAAVSYSDNTAANLLLARVGGPGAVTRFLRRLGDDRTRLDRPEPDVNSAVPGDPRDTSSARLLASDYLRLATGGVLSPANRNFFSGLLLANTTGDKQIRSAVPRGWRVGDKTGAGKYGTTNDIAVIYPPGRDPFALAVLTASDQAAAASDPAAVAGAARIAIGGI